MDNLRSYANMKDMDTRMNNMKVDIVCIQETHNKRDREVNTDNYNIYFSKADGEGENETGVGGVSSMIRGYSKYHN